MIMHVAIFTWVEGVEGSQVDELTAALQEMAERLPMLRSYRCGANLRVRPGGDYAVVAVVDDPAALEAYLDSDEHRAVYERLLGRMTAERQAAQIPFEPAVGNL